MVTVALAGAAALTSLAIGVTALVVGSNQPSQETVNRQTVINEFASRNNQICMAWSRANANNNKVVVNNSERVDVTIEADAETDMTCLLNQQANTSIVNNMKSQANQTSSQTKGIFSWLGGGDTGQVSNNTQTMYNTITSVNNTVCGAISQSTADNNLVVYNQVQGGNIVISADASAISSCSATNVISTQSYNDMFSQQGQKSTARSIFVAIAVVIAFIVIVIGIVIAISVSAKAASSAVSKKNEDPLTQELETLNAPA